MKIRAKVVLIILLVIFPREITGAPVINNMTITGDTTWDGEIIVQGIITVQRKAVLTILPGTVMRFTPPDGELDVMGTLKAIGTEDKKIIFTSVDENNTADKWKGLTFSGEKSADTPNQLSNCVINSADAGIYCFAGGSVTVENCVLNKNNMAVGLSQGSSVIIKRCNFMDNAVGGVFSEQSMVNISNSRFLNNTDFGISFLTGNGAIVAGNFISGHERGVVFSFLGTDGIIKNNVIQDNKYGIYTDRLAKMVISNNTIQNNDYGIYVKQDAVPKIFLNEITKNRIGIFIMESYNLNTLNIHDNNIYENKEYEAGLNRSSAEYARESIKAALSGDTTVDYPPYIKSHILSGLQPLEYFDAKRNFWGKELTEEMNKKGDSSNISKILDFYDDPENKETKNYFLYSGWRNTPVEGAGAKEGPLNVIQNDSAYVPDTAQSSDSSSQTLFQKRYKFFQRPEQN